MTGNRFITNMSYLVAGIGFGAAAGILFAPKSGKQTRRLIANKAGDTRDYITERGREVRRQANEAMDKGRDYVTRQKERFAEVLRVN